MIPWKASSSSLQVEFEFRSVDFRLGKETGEPGEKQDQGG